MKKYKIVNKVRFFRFIVLILTLTLASSIVLASNIDKSRVKNQDKITLTEKELEFIAQYDQVEVFVKKGQTAWHIQQKLTPNEDVRKLLYYDSMLNQKSMGDIKAGEKLIFLKERN